MKNLWRYVVLVMFLAQSATAGSGDRVRVYATVNSETAIYPGDVFQYSIVVEGGGKPSKIDISGLTPFSPRPAGDGTSYQQFNDQVVVSYSSNYAIAAKEVGTMHLPGVTVVVGGRTYTTNPVDVTVSKPGTTDRMTVEFSISDRKCYVGQPIVMTVRWIVSARWQNVGFDVPVFKSDDFLIEEVSSSAAGEQTLIDGVPTTVQGSRQQVNGMEAEVFVFSKVLIPQRAGRIRLDPISVATNMATGRVRTNNPFTPYSLKFERVSVQSDPIELEVLALPETGKPAEFYGLVGQYTISASAAPTQVSVGDPITVTIRIGGNPYLKAVQWPQLDQVPDLASNFKIPAEKASPTLESGFKVFTQTLRANSDAVKQIPPIPLAYFDSQRGEYAVVRTDPIPLEVAPTKMLTNADLEGAGFTPVNREVEAIRKGLSANYYGPEVLVDQSFSLGSAVISPGYAAIWSIPLMGLVASVVIRVAGRTSPESVARRRRRRAAGLAARQLKAVASADPRLRAELLLSALKSYIGDRFDRVAASLTPDDCREVIAKAIDDSAVATRYGDLLAACEGSRYSPLATDIGSSQAQEAMELIDGIEKRAKR
ncbi:MAG: BatD family protein [Phycisphaerales bacterium]